jgi:hypothetical protein
MNDGEGPAGTNAEFVDALATLKERGSALLVVGSVPESEYLEASRQMLGTAGAVRPRRRLLLLSGDDGYGIRERLANARNLGPDTCRIVTYDTHARSASAAGADLPLAEVPVQRLGDAGLGELGVAVDEAVGAFEAAADGGLSPSELRVAFDLLPTLLEEYDEETVFRFLHVFTMQIRAVGGMAHVYLPKPLTDETTRTLAPLFDAVVELRLDGGQLRQRWHFRDVDLVSEWLQFDAPGTE